jgi:hydroxymethylglutaryl-CoA lyase
MPFSAGLPVTLIECPRDAMQGWPHIIPTARKIEYLNALLKVGFDTLDFGSFVSPRAIPQMADTAEVLAGLDTEGSVYPAAGDRREFSRGRRGGWA